MVRDEDMKAVRGHKIRYAARPPAGRGCSETRLVSQLTADLKRYRRAIKLSSPERMRVQEKLEIAERLIEDGVQCRRRGNHNSDEGILRRCTSQPAVCEVADGII